VIDFGFGSAVRDGLVRRRRARREAPCGVDPPSGLIEALDRPLVRECINALRMLAVLLARFQRKTRLISVNFQSPGPSTHRAVPPALRTADRRDGNAVLATLGKSDGKFIADHVAVASSMVTKNGSRFGARGASTATLRRRIAPRSARRLRRSPAVLAFHDRSPPRFHDVEQVERTARLDPAHRRREHGADSFATDKFVMRLTGPTMSA